MSGSMLNTKQVGKGIRGYLAIVASEGLSEEVILEHHSTVLW